MIRKEITENVRILGAHLLFIGSVILASTTLADEPVPDVFGGVTIERDDGSMVTTYPDGTRVVESVLGTTTYNPDGSSVSRWNDGSVSETWSDGTTTVTRPNGRQTRRTADGVTVVKEPDGTDHIIRPDGTHITIKPDRTWTVTQPDGTTLIYEKQQNGTWVERNLHTGETRVVTESDGSDATAREKDPTTVGLLDDPDSFVQVPCPDAKTGCIVAHYERIEEIIQSSGPTPEEDALEEWDFSGWVEDYNTDPSAREYVDERAEEGDEFFQKVREAAERARREEKERAEKKEKMRRALGILRQEAETTSGGGDVYIPSPDSGGDISARTRADVEETTARHRSASSGHDEGTEGALPIIYEDEKTTTTSDSSEMVEVEAPRVKAFDEPAPRAPTREDFDPDKARSILP